MINLKKLHHNAYRCNNSENTRKFYEDFLGLPLVDAFEISTTMTGRATKVLHTFYSLNDRSSLAFFEVANKTFKYKKWHDFDLHIALQVDENILLKYYKLGKDNGIETRGISDHGFIKSVYFRDPDGYVIELTSPIKNYKIYNKKTSREVLDEWTLNKNE